MSCRKGCQLHVAKLDWLAEVHFPHRSFAKAVLIESSRFGRAKGQFVPRDMVCMGMRDKGTRLPSPDVDPQSRACQKQPVVKMKHSIVFDLQFGQCFLQRPMPLSVVGVDSMLRYLSFFACGA